MCATNKTVQSAKSALHKCFSAFNWKTSFIWCFPLFFVLFSPYGLNNEDCSINVYKRWQTAKCTQLIMCEKQNPKVVLVFMRFPVYLFVHIKAKPLCYFWKLTIAGPLERFTMRKIQTLKILQPMQRTQSLQINMKRMEI